ncbi:MAG: DUF2293 domain-containing protein [Nitratireductor sp.]|nr:DUF2293 domain-containing protein [Nitratireductor sp.]MCC0022303.1 DUF2293 domain-containing protein [Nitratireductor sp.]
MTRPAPTRRNKDVAKALRELVPRATLADFEAVMEIAMRGHLRHLPPGIIAWQALTTHVRHNHTEYDALLEDGYDSQSARHFVLDRMNEVLAEWGSPRRIHDEDVN